MKQEEMCVLPLSKVREYQQLLKSGKKWHADFVCECLEDLLIANEVESNDMKNQVMT